MLGLCVKAILIAIIKMKRTAGEDPFQAHYAHLALWGCGKWEGGRRESLSLAWASAFQRRVLNMTVPGACGLLRTPVLHMYIQPFCELFESVHSFFFTDGICIHSFV